VEQRRTGDQCPAQMWREFKNKKGKENVREVNFLTFPNAWAKPAWVE